MILKKFSLLIIGLILSGLILTVGNAQYNKNHEFINFSSQINNSTQKNSDISENNINKESKIKPIQNEITVKKDFQIISEQADSEDIANPQVSIPKQAENNVQNQNENTTQDQITQIPTQTPTQSLTTTPIQQEQVQEKPVDKKQVNVSIEGIGDYKIDILENDTAWDIMKRAANRHHFAMTYKIYDFGVFVMMIGEKKCEGGYYWSLYYNGSYSMVGVSDLKVQPNDTIGWKYESWM